MDFSSMSLCDSYVEINQPGGGVFLDHNYIEIDQHSVPKQLDLNDYWKFGQAKTAPNRSCDELSRCKRKDIEIGPN